MSQNCLFICSPSLGLLDNWIPVLNKLKKQKFKIDIFFPKITTVEQFNTSNFLSKEAFKTFNNVIYQDLYDDLFSETNAPLNQKELPSREEIVNYLQEVHECFLSEIRYHKKSDLLFALVNHNYKHIHDISNLLHLMGRFDSNLRPNSERIISQKSEVPHFRLPVYSN